MRQKVIGTRHTALAVDHRCKRGMKEGGEETAISE